MGEGEELKNWFAQCEQEALSLSKEERQKVLDLANIGLTIGEVCKKLNLSLPTICGVINMNIFSKSFLRRQTN